MLLRVLVLVSKQYRMRSLHPWHNFLLLTQLSSQTRDTGEGGRESTSADLHPVFLRSPCIRTIGSNHNDIGEEVIEQG